MDSVAIQLAVMTWKIGNVPNKLNDQAEEPSGQSAEHAACLLAPCNKMSDQTDIDEQSKE